MDVNRFDAGLCITCTDGGACQRESRPSHTLTPPHSPVSLLLPSPRLLWLCMHPHPLSHPLSHPLPQPNPCPCPPRHVGCSPSPVTESPGLEGRQELQRRCLSRLVGENRELCTVLGLSRCSVLHYQRPSDHTDQAQFGAGAV